MLTPNNTRIESLSIIIHTTKHQASNLEQSKLIFGNLDPITKTLQDSVSILSDNLKQLIRDPKTLWI